MRSNEIPLVDFLLVGGGLASATAAETLRAAGAEGSVAILCAETTPPYHRPPLSKSFLLNGPNQTTNILIHDEAFYRDHQIDVRTSSRAFRSARLMRQSSPPIRVTRRPRLKRFGAT